MTLTEARDQLTAALALLTEAREEIEWWADNHQCCRGKSDELLTAMDALLENAPIPYEIVKP